MTDIAVLCECFARDGLQHEPEFLPTALKIDVINRFSALGFRRVEATSFANPKNLPQFADPDAVLTGIERRPGVRYKATCANLRAVERALVAADAGHGPEEVSVLVSATESHTRKNLNRSREEQWNIVGEAATAARGRFLVVGTISVALGCPFEGRVHMEQVVSDAKRFVALGVRHIAIGDTTGMGNPKSVKALFRELMAGVPGVTWIAHFHDTRGTAIANCVGAYEAGVTHFDSAFGGVGGLASVASWAARFSVRFTQIPLSVISRDASARNATLFIFNDLQAAGSISNLVGRWGIGKRSPRCARIHFGQRGWLRTSDLCADRDCAQIPLSPMK